MSEIKITSDDIQEVSTLKSTPLYVSKYSENNFKHLTLRPYGGDSASTNNGKKTTLNGYTVQFNIPTNTFAISPFTSYYKYTGEFNFKFTKAGKYMLKNKKWYFQEATLTAGTPGTSTGSYVYSSQPTCVCVGARNSFCCIDRTVLEYSTKTNEDLRVYQQRTFYQNMLSGEIQDKQCSTWFDGDNNAWVVEFIPTIQQGGVRTIITYADYLKYKVSGAIATALPVKNNTNPITTAYGTQDGVLTVNYSATVADTATMSYIELTVQKDFILPWNLINMALDHEHQEYFNAIGGQDVIMRLQFCNTYFGYLFAKQNGDVLDSKCIINCQTSGIIKNELHLMVRNDEFFKSDLQAQNQIIHKIQPYEVWNVATRTSMSGIVDEPIQRPMKSINDLYLMFSPQENNSNEWNYYRQDSTFFTCDQIVDITNGKYDGKLETFAPMNFNLKRNGGSDRIFTEDINCIETYRQEVLRCMNYTGNNYLGTPSCLSSLNNMQLQDMYIAVNLQQWALDLNVNPIMDGVDNSGSARLMMTWRIGMYKDYLVGNAPSVYGSETYSGKNTVLNYDAIAYINYDAFSCFNVQNKTWSITENIKQYTQ